MTGILTEDGLTLEAQWDDAVEPSVGSVVLCHPHPLDGGTMHALLLERVARLLAAAGFHVLRFNFRGVGASEGKWSEGKDEVRDVAAAMEAAHLAFPDETTALVGWSFGATTSLRWQAQSGSEHAWVGIAPGIGPYRGTDPPDTSLLRPAARLIIAGVRDQFAAIDAFEEYAADIGARLEIVPASDHFFCFREDRVGALAVRFLGGRSVPGHHS